MVLILYVLICISMVLAVIAIHHEALSFVGKILLPRFSRPRRWHVSLTVFIFVCAHIIEIVVCAFAFYISGEFLGIGNLLGAHFNNTFNSYLYYSFASYTSLGLGDIYPVGFLKLLTGVEALVGLLMIGWTASFLLLEMRSFWSLTPR